MISSCDDVLIVQASGEEVKEISRIPILTPPLPRCVTLGKSINLRDLFLSSAHGDNRALYDVTSHILISLK